VIRTATQIKALIKNRTDGDSDKAQVLLRVYMMERLLERISISRYKDCFILKGGMLVASLVGIDTRATVDIDTTVRSLPLSLETAERFLNEIMAIELDDGVTFRITKKSEIMEGSAYEGIRFFILGTVEKLRQTIKIDISTGDEITPAAVRYEFPLILEDRKIPLWSYNLETILAEKLETVMSRGIANTRMRDFYDIHVLLDLYRRTIDEETMKKAFAATCQRRLSENNVENLDEILLSVKESMAMKDNWRRYCEDSLYTGNLSWETVMDSVYLLKGIATNKD